MAIAGKLRAKKGGIPRCGFATEVALLFKPLIPKATAGSDKLPFGVLCQIALLKVLGIDRTAQAPALQIFALTAERYSDKPF